MDATSKPAAADDDCLPTQGLLRDLDDALCEIISGCQGSYEPDRHSREIAQQALHRLRAASARPHGRG